MAFAPSSFAGALARPLPRATSARPTRTTTCCATRAAVQLSEAAAEKSPAIDGMAEKYVFPMRDTNTQVFFDNSIDDEHTLLILFAEDRHGLVLDAVSVLRALNVSVKRTASAQSDAVRLLMHRIEGELVSLKSLHISLDNCVAFWVVDAESGEQIYDDQDRLDQITGCLKFELNTQHPRPIAADPDAWHRVTVQKNRADRFTAFQVQTDDRPGLLAELTSAFKVLNIDVASAAVNTYDGRVENTFFVTKHGFREPLSPTDVDLALEEVMKALLVVGQPGDNETLWYQVRDGTGIIISEALFMDVISNKELSIFSKHETPNFRGRLPSAPYRPVMLQ